ncbi:nodulation protein NfeD [Vibrio sp. LQ2]|uniref:NfeD family protein n=1 Tax=Vibrio sp. LQ2 TaxID=2883075 RepID=UPI001C9DF0FA|nr:nodulation protein NfeD [Vibrio sp. LQ2]MBY7794771.1 nodulation protein NfeD [Vibrio fluvialis]USP07521.1 nodulation protein NfeD [Vibrio sp. LQ2]
MYRRVMEVLLTSLLSFSTLATADTTNAPAAPSQTVPVIAISGAIGPAVGDYVIKELQRANQQVHAPAVIVTLDTPGGLSSTLRDINQHILASDIPVLCLVYPPGARAASAGTYILYACHIAAMAPATTLGAATPVQIGGPSPGGGEQQDKPSEPTAMEKKVLNDSIAYIRSLAQLRGRNVEWAEKAVRDAATLSAIEALEMNVINVMAESPQDLLNAVNGQTLDVNHRAVSLNVDKAQLEIREPDLRNQFLATITDPNVAYILMMIGVYGLLLEFYTPSFGIAGITGAISLLIALYAFQLLPVNYVGMGLMLLGIALFIAESFLPSFGLLGIGGIVAFVLGSVFLIDSDLPELQVSLGLIYSIAAVSAALIIFVLSRVMELRRKQVVSGQEAMLGMEGMALDSFESQGFVHVDGERWEALSDVPLRKGDLIRVIAVDGLTLQVTKK